MSFAFTVRGATAALAIAALKVKMAEVVLTSPEHASHSDSVVSAAEQAINDLVERPDNEIAVSANGSLTGQWEREEGQFVLKTIESSAMSVSAHLIAVPPQPKPIEEPPQQDPDTEHPLAAA